MKRSTIVFKGPFSARTLASWLVLNEFNFKFKFNKDRSYTFVVPAEVLGRVRLQITSWLGVELDPRTGKPKYRQRKYEEDLPAKTTSK